MQIIRHIHANYDGPKNRCTVCAARPLTRCYRCNGLSTNPNRCGFCYDDILTIAAKIEGAK